MGRCLKVLNLLIEKKIAEMEKNKLKAWEYEGMIKRHVEKCPNCDQLLQGIYQKSKISDADFSQSSTEALARLSSSATAKFTSSFAIIVLSDSLIQKR